MNSKKIFGIQNKIKQNEYRTNIQNDFHAPWKSFFYAVTLLVEFYTKNPLKTQKILHCATL